MRTRSLLRLSLILAVFLAQWALFAHDYQEHDAGQPCEICVSSSSVAHALPASAPEPLAPQTLGSLSLTTAVDHPTLPPRRRYLVRGPPAALS